MVSIGTVLFTESQIQRALKPSCSGCCLFWLCEAFPALLLSVSLEPEAWKVGHLAGWWFFCSMDSRKRHPGQKPHISLPPLPLLPLLRALLTFERPFGGSLILPSPQRNLELGKWTHFFTSRADFWE